MASDAVIFSKMKSYASIVAQRWNQAAAEPFALNEMSGAIVDWRRPLQWD